MTLARVSGLLARPKLWIVFACSAALVLILSFALGMAFCAGTMKVPRKPPLNRRSDSSARIVEVTARDGARLAASFIPNPRGGSACVIVLHGIADSRQGSAGFAPMFIDAGYSVLLPDSRAHGESGGEFVTYGLLEKYDVLHWAQWMERAGCTRIYGLGESLGAAILIQSSAMRPVFRAIAAECSYADLRSIGRYRLSRWLKGPLILRKLLAPWAVESGIVYARLRYGFDLSQVSPQAAIRRSTTPVLLIHGAADIETPPEHSAAILRANPALATLWLVPNAVHTGAAGAAGPEFRRRLLEWFSAH